MSKFTFHVLRLIIMPMVMARVANAEFCDKYLTADNLQLITSYATWRNINSISIFNEAILSDCNVNRLKTLASYLYERQIFLSLQPFSRTHKNDNNNWNDRRIQIVIFDGFFENSSMPSNNIVAAKDDISKINWHIENRAWLMVSAAGEESKIFDKLKFMALPLSTDLAIAFLTSFTRTEDMENTTYSPIIDEDGSKNENLSPAIKSSISNHVNDNNSYCNFNSSTEGFCIVQAYKIREELNTSLVTNVLGLWTVTDGTSNLSEFRPVEKRTNFGKFPIKFGVKNATKSISPDAIVIDDEGYDDNFTEFSNYFTEFFNASEEILYFQKLGYKGNDGEWTDLLRAVVNEEVDVALHSVIKTPNRFLDMAFTHKVMTSIRNIYVKPQQSNELRDIFLVPFGGRLIGCVLAIGVVLTLIITLVGRCGAENDRISLGDALIWCVGIFTLQGSAWTPNTCPGNIILLVSLLFALVIFNSYSAFITSILSVEVSKIRSVDDLLHSDYTIGYAKNSQDEIYLRNMNETQLQQIYLRGYLQNTVNDITEGLMRSTRGNYGFFASSNVARKELQIINNYKCSDDISEISVELTRNTVAFPLSKTSPFRKIINLSMLKMYETGVYKYVHNKLIPDLPLCEKKRIFKSAHLPDLTTAFGILILGVYSSIIVLIAECLWKKKRRIYTSLTNKWHHRHQIHNISIPSEEPALEQPISYPYMN